MQNPVPLGRGRSREVLVSVFVLIALAGMGRADESLPNQLLQSTRTRPALHSLYNVGGTDHPSCGHDEKGISEVGHPEEEI